MKIEKFNMQNLEAKVLKLQNDEIKAKNLMSRRIAS